MAAEATVAEISGLLFSILRQMDRDACTVRNNAPCGLNWYGGHSRPELKKPATEPEWSKALASRLVEHGVSAKAEVAYRGTRERCDLVITQDDGSRFWIEIKGAWKEYWRTRNRVTYRSYLLHPLVPNLDQSKTHTVPFDLRKLERLPKDEASRIGLLLVGFDSVVAPMDDDVRKLIELAGLGGPAWTAAHTDWPDAYRSGEQVRCWFWHREVADPERAAL